MEHGVLGLPGLRVAQIVFNSDEETAIIQNHLMGVDTVLAMICFVEIAPVACVNVSYMLNKIYIGFYSLGINHLYSEHFVSNRKDEIKTCILAKVFENYTFFYSLLGINHLYSKSISLKTEKMV